jgi:hypothetical protein
MVGFQELSPSARGITLTVIPVYSSSQTSYTCTFLLSNSFATIFQHYGTWLHFSRDVTEAIGATFLQDKLARVVQFCGHL